MLRTLAFAFSLTLGLLLLAISSTAQDWQPVVKDKLYFYQADTSNHLTHQIQVDSAFTRNGHQVRLLNTGLHRCDTCSPGDLPVVGNPGRFRDTAYYHLDHAFFWQRKVVDSNGRYYFYGNQDFVIAPNQPEDSAWLFQPETGLTARIDSAYQAPIFGKLDSVKRIKLSSGATMRLTKNHGILLFPDVKQKISYRLKGIQDSSRHGTTFGFRAIYDFEVGDVFQYKARGLADPQQRYEKTISRLRIKDKKVRGDTFIYQVAAKNLVDYGRTKLLSSRTNWLKFYPGGRLPYTSQYESVGFDQANRFPGEAIQGSEYREAEPVFRSSEKALATSCRITVDSNGRLTKTLGRMAPGKTPNFYLRVRDSIYQTQGNVSGQYVKRFKKGLGLIYHDFFFFETGSSRKLMGYVKGSDTVGTIYSDQKFKRLATGISHSQRPSIQTYPNPVRQNLYIANLMPGQTAEIRVYNQMGQVVKTQTTHRTRAQLGMAELEPGLYILKIEDGEQVRQRKVLKR
jgi:hypothetical protein